MTLHHDELSRRFEQAGQQHVLRYLERLDSARQTRLRKELQEVDLELTEILGRLLKESALEQPAPAFEPPELFPLERSEQQESAAEVSAAHGRELLASGKVGFLLVAGGQGSRLGLDGPKGAFLVGPVSGRSLFEVHARRLLAVGQRYGVATPWYVMTSPANDEDTRTFFARHDHFGLPPGDVFFFAQDMLPALDAQGRIAFAGPDALFLAPNGHGGVFSGLSKSGALADMRSRGLELLSYFQVDNPLARSADPLFLGLHDKARAGMSTKVVSKRDPGEKVGVIGRADGKMGCIEYSDLPAELREAREGNQLRFRAGNIAVHILDVDFASRVAEEGAELPWHIAAKKMRLVDEEGASVEREGFKFETFVFDALAHAPRSVTLEVDRTLEFSPVKNARGEDSPASVRADLCGLYAGWARAAELPLPPVDPHGIHPVEVDPLFADSEEEFLRRVREDSSTAVPKECNGGHFYG